MMNRVQKKCFIASTGVHLLLVVILFLGSGFFSGSKKAETVPEIQFVFVPDILNPNGPSGGGNPRATPPSQKPLLSTPPAPPKAEPEKTRDATAQKERAETKTEKATKVDPNSYESKKKLSSKELTLVNKGSKTSDKSKKKSSANDEEQKLAEARREASNLIRQAAGGLSSSSAVKVDGSLGPGGGGPTYASYASWVQMVYWDAWVAPDDSESGIVRVKVTIASDGSVVESWIVGGSGDSGVDASVQRTLKRVTTMHRPFPEGMNEKQITYTIKFDLRAKKGMA